MTKLLFWEDPYLKEFGAKVQGVEWNSIILDQTCFYPEGGGQPGDTGLIGEVRVTNSRFLPDKRTVIHTIIGESNLSAGQEVSCMIDWERRYKIMRLHSALHLVYSVFIKKYGEHRVIGSNMNESKGRVDFAFFGPVDIESLTNEVAKVISQEIPIRLEASEADPYKRSWILEGFDPVPCGGTHPRNTSEIGNIILKRKNLGKQGQRIYVSLA